MSFSHKLRQLVPRAALNPQRRPIRWMSSGIQAASVRGSTTAPLSLRTFSSQLQASTSAITSHSRSNHHCYSTSLPRYQSTPALAEEEDADPPEMEIRDTHSILKALKRLLEFNSPNVPYAADVLLKHCDAPNFECYYWAIECWTRTKRKGAAERMEALYRQLLEKSEREDQKDQVQTALLHVLKAYSHVANAHIAEELLLQFAEDYRSQKLVPPTMEMCKAVLSTWPRSDSSRRAYRAERFLTLMSKDPVFPNPDIVCYTLALNCWASSGKEEAPQRAEKLMRSMEKLEDEALRPNLLTYSCVINAWARSPKIDAPNQAERLLREMEETKKWVVDRVVYTAMISVWGRSKQPGAIRKAEEYFERLQKLSTSASATLSSDENSGKGVERKATVVEYTALIQAWAYYVGNHRHESQRGVDRVEELLAELMKKYFTAKVEGDKDADSMRPNRLTFASIFRTLKAARNLTDRPVRAERMMGEMEKLKLAPNKHIEKMFEKCSRS